MEVSQLWFRFVRFYVQLGLYFYAKKIRVVGIKNVPKKGAVLFAVNHPNGLLDPLIIIPILRSVFQFPNGIPKIHEHEKKPAQGFGLFYEGRLIVFYDYETDLSDGWEDEIIHNNPKKIREKALKMGSNIIEYAFTN